MNETFPVPEGAVVVNVRGALLLTSVEVAMLMLWGVRVTLALAIDAIPRGARRVAAASTTPARSDMNFIQISLVN
jgi:hypothetical protein